MPKSKFAVLSPVMVTATRYMKKCRAAVNNQTKKQLNGEMPVASVRNFNASALRFLTFF
jgi:hypothetical protein